MAYRSDMSLPYEPPFVAYVGNLPYAAVEGDIKNIFSTCEVVDVIFKRSPNNGEFLRYGFVEFEDQNSLKKALNYDGAEFKGSTLKVNLARNVMYQQRGLGKRQRGGRGGGFSSGRRSPSLSRTEYVAYVEHLPFDVIEPEVYNLFQDSEIVNVELQDPIRHDGLRSAYVEFEDHDSLEAALTYDETFYRHNRINVTISVPRRNAGDRPSIPVRGGCGCAGPARSRPSPRGRGGGYRGRASNVPFVIQDNPRGAASRPPSDRGTRRFSRRPRGRSRGGYSADRVPPLLSGFSSSDSSDDDSYGLHLTLEQLETSLAGFLMDGFASLSFNATEPSGACARAPPQPRIKPKNPDAKKEPIAPGDECKICMDAPIECVLLNCGHMAACYDCGRQLDRCPICRNNINSVHRVYKS